MTLNKKFFFLLVVVFSLLFNIDYVFGKENKGTGNNDGNNGGGGSQSGQIENDVDEANRNIQIADEQMSRAIQQSQDAEISMKIAQDAINKGNSLVKDAERIANDMKKVADLSGSSAARARYEEYNSKVTEARMNVERAQSVFDYYFADYQKAQDVIANGGDAPPDGNIKPENPEMVDQLINETNASESDYRDCYKEFEEAERELLSIQERFKNIKSDSEIHQLLYEWKKQNAIFLEKKTNVEKSMNGVIDAYKALGDYYKETGYVGDPVFIGDGSFFVEYEDFVAEDYLQKFGIKRQLCSSSICDSLGIGWTCSLDSRIARCVFEDKTADKLLMERGISICRRMANAFSKGYSASHNGEISIFLNYANSKRNFYEIELADVYEMIKIRDSLLEQNKYCMYGRYSTLDSVYGFQNTIIFLDEDGRQHYFQYQENGKWIALGELTKGKIEIYNLSGNGLRSESDDCSGGYEVCYSDDTKMLYNQYGILYKKIDNNANEVTYISSKGLINEVITKTGEHIFIKRNETGLIEEIIGEVSGRTKFSYKGKSLQAVVDNRNIKIEYEYVDHRLSKIKKSDGNIVKIDYEYDGKSKNYVCSKITAENGSFEAFTYDFQNRKVTHKTNEGKIEYYKLNEFGSPISIKDLYGNETTFKTNSRGLITEAIFPDGIKKFFSYDDLFRPCSIQTENGSLILLSYCEENRSNRVKSIIDADGFNNHFVYDKKGNIIEEYINDTLVTKMEYYPNGLLKKSSDMEQTISYEYNEYGSITLQKLQKKNGKTFAWYMTYDEKNRVVKIEDAQGDVTEISYYLDYQIEKNPRITKKTFFDFRNRVIKEESIDLIYGSKKIKEYVYENENITKVLIDGVLYEEYEYSNDNELISKTKYNLEGRVAREGVQEKYVFSKNYVSEYIKQHVTIQNENSEMNGKNYVSLIDDKNSVCKYEYSTSGGNKVVKYINEMGLESTATYNQYGNIINEIFPNGYGKKYVYSNAGRIMKIIDTDYKVWDYVYKNDCSYEIILSTPNGTINKSDYDRKGRLKSSKDIVKGVSLYEYEGEYCILEKTKEYVKECEYDYYGREISDYCMSLIDGKIVKDYKIIYNNNENSIKLCTGSNLTCFYECKLDGFGRMIQVLDRNGITTFKYDSLDRVIQKTDGEGYKTEYEYDANDEICYVLFSDQNERFIKHDVNGNTTCVIENGVIVKETIYDVENKKASFLDMCGTQIDYFYDKHGLITREKNSKAGEYVHSERSRSEKKSFGTLTRNVLDRITVLKNENSSFHYEYDLMQNITSIEDTISGSSIRYEYDDFGRCIHQITDTKEAWFNYDLRGNVSEILDERKIKLVSFEYDSRNREIFRQYFNGITERTSYNKNNLVESKIIQDKSNQLLQCDFLLYDKKNRLEYKFDSKGDYTHYTYKENGQVHSIEYPLTDELWNYNSQEAFDCGYPLQEKTKGSLLYLDFSSMNKINTLLQKTKTNMQIRIPDYEVVWKEVFEYTKNGSVCTVDNPIGKLILNYDNNNRIIEKFYENFEERKMTFFWNENGNLSCINGMNSKLELTYTDTNRIQSIDYVNKAQDYRKIVNYKYDSLNRRILEYDGNNYISYMYDGFSTVVAEKYPIFENGIKNQYNLNNYVGNDFYRLGDDRLYEAFGTERSRIYDRKNGIEKNENKEYLLKSGIESTNEINYIVRGDSVISSCDDEYILNVKDFQKNLVVDVNDYDSVLHKYDSFRNDYSTDYNLFNQIQNLGYRDYIPSIKSFTSEDPICDGTNWYCYCAGDSVNYFDSIGFAVMNIPQSYLMTDAYYKGLALGNSSTETIDKYGCYITSHADILLELYKQNILPEDKEQFISVIGINTHQELFLNGSDESSRSLLNKEKVDNTLFTFTTDTHTVSAETYTKSKHFGGLDLQMEMARMYGSKNEYAVEGIFDLSSDFPAAGTNHMVILNDLADDKGVFRDITNTSKNDQYRRDDNANTYSQKNLKELRVVKIEKNCVT